MSDEDPDRGRSERDPARGLRAALLSPAAAEAIGAHGQTDAAVLVPLFGFPRRPGLVFTERRHDLRRHAGEISFPGGRRDDPAEELRLTALREAEEEIGLVPEAVELVGALPPVGTFVTGFKVHPFVGLIGDELAFEPNPAEVETVLAFSIAALRESFAMRRLVRRGIPFRTPTYVVDGHLIWGATARILAELLQRLSRL
jgi:8-oxo-dGTP pyrophosphatase MutT (NUDIX family)